MVKIEFAIATTEDAARAAIIAAAIAAAFGAPVAAPKAAPLMSYAQSAAPVENRARATRQSRKAVDPVAAYEAITGAAVTDTAAPEASEPEPVQVAETVQPPEPAPAPENPDEPTKPADAPGEVTLDMVRPLVRLKGVLFGRDALERYGVKGFTAMTPAQLSALYAELTAEPKVGAA